MKRFVAQFGVMVLGVLKSFDRMLFRGTLTELVYLDGMWKYLSVLGISHRDRGRHMKEASERVEEASLAAARAMGVDVVFVPRSDIRKEDVARQIVEKRRITEGPVVLMKSIERCNSYRAVPSKRIRGEFYLRQINTKCLHLYLYLLDPVFGLVHARLQTWFPFNIQVCMNGHEWLARAMGKAGLRYEQKENCFTWLADPVKAQKLAERFLKFRWERELDRFARLVNPGLPEVLGTFRSSYYWSLLQSEVSTDVLFRDTADLEALIGPLVHHGITGFGSQDVMRFLGRKLDGNFKGEVISTLRRRPEGIRLRHDVGHNSIKIYNKQGSVLRVETTINEPSDFKVFRSKQGDPGGKKAWRPLRKGIADIRSRAKISEDANDRYLEALVSADTTSPLGDVFATVSKPCTWRGRRVRAIRPWDSKDFALLQAVNRGEFVLGGFRNADLLRLLFKDEPSRPEDRKKRVAQITRLIRLLRAHRLVRKVSRARRYKVTPEGRRILTTILEAHHVTLEQLRHSA